jgi:hypothetical protein
MEVERRNHEAELLTLTGLHPSLFCIHPARQGRSYAETPAADLLCHGRSSAETPAVNLARHGCPLILPQRNKKIQVQFSSSECPGNYNMPSKILISSIGVITNIEIKYITGNCKYK